MGFLNTLRFLFGPSGLQLLLSLFLDNLHLLFNGFLPLFQSFQGVYLL
jgi:hypothetical protein